MWYLRIFIDSDEGITIDDCEKVTEPVNKVLDEADPIAGLERELLKEDHFEVCKGDKVRIRLIRSIDGEKEFCAYLRGADKNELTVADENGEERVLRLEDIAFVKLWFDFD